MAKFLQPKEVYRMLQRELPEGVYPDGAPSAFFSTASIYAKAELAASGYFALERIYENYFPQSSVERIDDWVLKAFGYKFDASVPLQTKRARVLGKIQAQPKINLWEILTLVTSFVPEGTYVQVIGPCGVGSGNWSLGEKYLGLDTFLSGLTPLDVGVQYDEWCSFVTDLHWRLGVDLLGENTYLAEYSFTDIANVQANAYQYEIRIFDYSLSESQTKELSLQVAQAEPARSSHVIKQNQTLIDYGLVHTVLDVGQFSGVNCVKRNPSSSTGYDGIKAIL